MLFLYNFIMAGWLFRILLALCLKITEAICALLNINNYYWKKPTRCPPIKDKILLYPACILTEKIRERQLTTETVIKAYISRIKEVNPILNAVVEDRFALAINEAKGTDQMLATTKLTNEELTIKFPLLGVPLTVKESVALEGSSHCSGRFIPGGRKASRDANAIKLCKEAGAIPLLVSNTPELCMDFETYNKVTGTTCNPYDSRRTPGGSSGGEAALLGAGASLIGIGSDLCGSIRLPPHFCGVWGHKPSPGIISNRGHYPDCKDQELWKQVLHIGPMSRYAVDLPLLFNVMLEKGAKSILNMDQQVIIPKLQFYYMENDGGSILTHAIHKDILDAMRKLVQHLSIKRGCKVQKLQLNEMQYSAEMAFLKLFTIDDIDNLFNNNGDGAFLELIRFLTCRSNSVFPPILYGILRRITPCLLQKSTISHFNKHIFQLKRKICDILNTNGVLLYPTHPTAAGFHGESHGKVTDYGYTSIFNCLGFPVTNCPLGLNSEGLPIGIQVIAAPNNDNLTLAVAQEIEKEFGGWIPPQFSND